MAFDLGSGASIGPSVKLMASMAAVANSVGLSNVGVVHTVRNVHEGGDAVPERAPAPAGSSPAPPGHAPVYILQEGRGAVRTGAAPAAAPAPAPAPGHAPVYILQEGRGAVSNGPAPAAAPAPAPAPGHAFTDTSPLQSVTQPQGLKAPTVMTESDANLLSVADGSPCQIDCSGALATIKHSDEVVKEEVVFLPSASTNQWRLPVGAVSTVEITKHVSSQISAQIAAQIASSPDNNERCG